MGQCQRRNKRAAADTNEYLFYHDNPPWLIVDASPTHLHNACRDSLDNPNIHSASELGGNEIILLNWKFPEFGMIRCRGWDEYWLRSLFDRSFAFTREPPHFKPVTIG